MAGIDWSKVPAETMAKIKQGLLAQTTSPFVAGDAGDLVEYRCDLCQSIAVVVFRDTGLARKVISCRSKLCPEKQTMRLTGVAAEGAEPQYVWFRMNRANRRKKRGELRTYADNSGLFLDEVVAMTDPQDMLPNRIEKR